MRIIVDLQGAQTESRYRGIGRYSTSLVKAIIRNKGEHQVLLVLNGLFSETIEPLRKSFDGLLPQENILVWVAPSPVRECEPNNDWRREVAEYIREAFIADLNPDMVLVTSLFEGFVDDAVTSIGAFNSSFPTSVILYDLIPLINPELYLTENLPYNNHYNRKIKHLKQADLWLSISESSAMEGQETLSLPSERIANISTACDEIFKIITIEEKEKQDLLSLLGISKPFILSSGSADARKNLQRLIKAYALIPEEIKKQYQLVLAGKISDNEVKSLREVAESSGLDDADLVIVGYITDDQLTRLYNLCHLFILPSLHEGFGLPALEAMNCGAVVIGSNTSSIPEVIGNKEALFDPLDEKDISRKIVQGLTDDFFREKLVDNSKKQSKKFSWDITAIKTIDVFEDYLQTIELKSTMVALEEKRPKLAYVSPLPPERSGIADYSVELLPVLANYYDIEVVVDQEEVNDEWVKSFCPIRNKDYLIENVEQYDRVLYHLGNSPFHQYMLDLIKQVSGTIMLHDFYLSSLYAYLESNGIEKNIWSRALYQSHGYKAVKERYEINNEEKVKIHYPTNYQLLHHARGVIVHSEHSRSLAEQWYGSTFSAEWKIIPLLRAQPVESDGHKSREILGIDPDSYVVCCFGFIDSTKLNHRLVDAWLRSKLANDPNAFLIFVGENHDGAYGRKLKEILSSSGLEKQIQITGWVDLPVFRNYLAAADLAVQLRTLSRGETSAAMLDCMNYGLPVIVKASGSFAELPSDAVWMLPDSFTDDQLVEALENLWLDIEKRNNLGRCAKEVIARDHSPAACAKKYYDAIEYFNAEAEKRTPGLIKAISGIANYQPTKEDCIAIAESVTQTLPLKQPVKQLLIDVTATCGNDLKTGVERVARSVTLALIDSPPEGYRVEPVYLYSDNGRWRYRYARQYTLDLIDCPKDIEVDDWVEVRPGDILLGADISGHNLVEAEKAGLIKHYRNIGVKVYYIVFDLLPIKMPYNFPPGGKENHESWLNAVSAGDGAICISKAVADDLCNWLEGKTGPNKRPFKVYWNHLGSDFENSIQAKNLPDGASALLERLKETVTFLMVGTIEPRKGYLQTLKAFSKLWDDGMDLHLVIVGKEGWLELPDNMRRTIPETINKIKKHPEYGKRLVWLEGISDQYLESIYNVSNCLIAASEGEGFGLPLVEAARHGLPIIARDIPVFREVAKNNVHYFPNDNQPEVLAEAIREWLEAYESNSHSKPDRMQELTWEESVNNLIKKLEII